MLTTAEVTRFISPPPTTVKGFERFIAWTLREQAAGRYVCFGVVPDGWDHAVGIIQVRALEPGFSVAEWGFAIGTPFWGTGIFAHSAGAVIEFVMAVVGVHRLEARATVSNGRGNGALRGLRAVQEALLRKSFCRRGEYVDQVLWSIVADDHLDNDGYEASLERNKIYIYVVLPDKDAERDGDLRVVDESGEDYLFSAGGRGFESRRPRQLLSRQPLTLLR